MIHLFIISPDRFYCFSKFCNFDFLSVQVQVHFGVIQCIYDFGHPYISKASSCKAKWTTIPSCEESNLTACRVLNITVKCSRSVYGHSVLFPAFDDRVGIVVTLGF